MSDETQTPETEAEVPAEPKKTIGGVATEVILARGTNEEALAAVQAEFPEAKTSLSSINWYRNKLRAEGKEVPTARELKKAAAAADTQAPTGGEKEDDGDF